MKIKDKRNSSIVFSTDPEFSFQPEPDEIPTLSPSKQNLRILLDKKNRAGKVVTIVKGFAGRYEDMEILGKQLKNTCGCGGSVKNGEIIVQGDNRERILLWLRKNDFILSKMI